jgi:hypothetical protein
MNKTTMVVLLAAALLIATSMTSLVAAPVRPLNTRKVLAGKASLSVPLHLPREVKTGTPVSGSVVLAAKEDCDITYDHFTAIHWSVRAIADTALVPLPAYIRVPGPAGSLLDLGGGKMASTRTLMLSAEKPCGKVDVDTFNVIDLYCGNSKTYYTIVGMQDPYMTLQKVVEIAKSLKCS